METKFEAKRRLMLDRVGMKFNWGSNREGTEAHIKYAARSRMDRLPLEISQDRRCLMSSLDLSVWRDDLGFRTMKM